MKVITQTWNFLTTLELVVIASLSFALHRLGLEPTFVDWLLTHQYEHYVERKALMA